MRTYRAAVIGCGRMGGFIDNEVADIPSIVLPYSHGGGFTTCKRTDLVACSDRREDLMAAFGERYSVPVAKQYSNYQELIAKEELDMISVATHVEHHADIVIHAAEHGIKAIYCEKGMAASLSEANAMAEACKRNDVAFNLGAHRRFHPGCQKVRELIDSGEIGEPEHLIMTYASGLYDHGCHTLDLSQYLVGDSPAVWVQGDAAPSEQVRDGNVYSDDPGGDGVVRFANGATLHLLFTNRYEYTVHCSNGMVGTYNDTVDWVLRKGARRDMKPATFPSFEPQSTTVNLISDLARALDTGEPPIGGVEAARAGVEIITAILESHLRGGERIELPLDRSELRLHRTNRQPWQKGKRWREPQLSAANA